MVNETSCLDENDVSDLLGGSLPPLERAAIDEHLDRCTTCRSLVSSVAIALQEHDESTQPPGASDPSLLRPVASLRRGDSLGRYVVLDVVGIGNMGVVYGAYDPDLDRRIAVKVLHEQAGRHRELAWREAKSMARLNHPHIVAVHDVGRAADRVFVAMEFVEGVTLRTWQNNGDRSWRDVLARYVDAGRGLAAAHEAGIVHRDFKPDNVLVGEDGRVRVSDLGLAAVTEVATSDSDPDLTGGVGTPRYMAPELHAGEPATPKSDQFAFCVALYEALYGEHPFEGETGQQLATATKAGRVRSTPMGASVPLALRRQLLIGLAPEPRERHPDMASLVETLRRFKYPRRAPVALALGVVAVAAGFVVVGSASEPTCEREDLGAIWNGEIRQRVGEQLETSSRAPLDRLDAFAAAWADVHHEACLATHERHTRTESDLELSGACLEQQRIELEALVSVIEHGDPDELASAVDSLPAPSRCRNVEALRAQGAPPNPRYRRQLARASALVQTGDHEGGLAIATAIAESANAEQDDASEAAAQWVAAWADVHAGRPVAAEERLHTALARAEQAAQPTLRWRAMVLLVFAVGYQQSRYDEGERWADLADALTPRAAPDETELAQLMRYRAIIAGERGNYEKSEVLLTDVLRRLERVDRTDHPLYSKTHCELGRTLLGLSRVSEAEDAFRQSLERDVRRLGPNHPYVANAAQGLGDALLRLERFDEARQEFNRALRILRARFGDQDSRVAGNHLALGRLELDAGTDLDAAEQALVAAKTGFESSGRTRTPLYMKTIEGLGRLRTLQGRPQEATRHYSRALEIGEAIHPEHPVLYELRFELAKLGRAQGDLVRARGLLEGCLAAADSDPERLRSLRVRTLIELAQLDLDMENPSSAAGVTRARRRARGPPRHRPIGP